MSKKMLFLVALVILAAFALIAADNFKSKEVVYIRPWSDEVTIDLSTQTGVVRMGWGTCSPGLAQDWIANTVIHVELYQGLVLLQSVDTGDARWVTSPNPDAIYADSCMHIGLPPQASYWDFARLHLQRPGDYILHFYVETTVPMTDGADYAPADGVMDFYPAHVWYDGTDAILIHVVR